MVSGLEGTEFLEPGYAQGMLLEDQGPSCWQNVESHDFLHLRVVFFLLCYQQVLKQLTPYCTL